MAKVEGYVVISSQTESGLAGWRTAGCCFGCRVDHGQEVRSWRKGALIEIVGRFVAAWVLAESMKRHPQIRLRSGLPADTQPHQ